MTKGYPEGMSSPTPLRRERKFADPKNDDRKSVMTAIEDLFGDKNRAQAWLRTPSEIFDGKSPREMLATSAGRLAIRHELNRIEHGMHW